MFVKKLVPFLVLVLWLLVPQGAKAATEQYVVPSGDTASWASRRVSGNDLAYRKHAHLIRNGKVVSNSKSFNWNLIYPGDIIVFDNADAKSETVPNQTILEFCAATALDANACTLELSDRNRTSDLSVPLHSAYVPTWMPRKADPKKPEIPSVPAGQPSSQSIPSSHVSIFTLVTLAAANEVAKVTLTAARIVSASTRILLLTYLVLIAALLIVRLGKWFMEPQWRERRDLISDSIYLETQSWLLKLRILSRSILEWQPSIIWQRLQTTLRGVCNGAIKRVRGRSEQEIIPLTDEEVQRRKEYMSRFAEWYVDEARDSYKQYNQELFTTEISCDPSELLCFICFTPRRIATFPMPAGQKFEGHYHQILEAVKSDHPECHPTQSFLHDEGDDPKTIITLAFTQEEVALNHDNFNHTSIVDFEQHRQQRTVRTGT
jgi:hypothetical protein